MWRLRKWILFLVVVLNPGGHPLTGQSVGELKSELTRASSDDQRVQLNSRIYIALSEYSMPNAVDYYDAALAMKDRMSTPETRFWFQVAYGLRKLKSQVADAFEEGFDAWEKAMAMQAGVSARARADFYSMYGLWLTQVDENPKGLALVNRALTMYDSIGVRAPQGAAYRAKATILYYLSDIKNHKANLFKSLEIYRETGDHNGEAWILNWLLNDAEIDDDTTAIFRYLEEFEAVEPDITARWLANMLSNRVVAMRWKYGPPDMSDRTIRHLIDSLNALDPLSAEAIYDLYYDGLMGRGRYDEAYAALKEREALIYQDKVAYSAEIIMGQNRLKVGDYAAAEVHFERTYLPSLLERLPLQYVSAAEGLAEVRAWQGRSQEAAQLFKEALTIKDSLFDVERVKAADQLEIAYDTEKKEDEIRRLGAENQIKDLRLSQSRLLRNSLIALAILLLALLVVGILLLRNRQKLRLERMRSEISRDLHDDVGGILAGLAMQADLARSLAEDHQDSELLDKLAQGARKAMGRMRDIVWVIDSRKATVQDLVDRIRDHATETLAGSETRLEVRLDGLSPGKVLRAMERQHIYLIAKEAITNAAKHAGARHLSLVLDQRKDEFCMTIRDDGRGLEGARTSGSGMSNMQARAERLGGKLRAGSLPDGAGTEVVLTCPRI